MRNALVVFLLLCFPVSATHAGEQPVLNVYTYDSFASDWGPGPQIKTAFEAQCDCGVNYVAVDGSTGILSRVRLEGAGSRADVVLGLDNNQIVDAQQTGLLTAHNVDLAELDLPFQWHDPTFLPFDYGYFAFIYNRDRLPVPPASFRELVDADDSLKILIQDPRSSTPGLGLMLWVKALYGDRAFEVWRKLSGKIVTVTRGWSEAYGLFLDGEADLVLSYTTSPAYHAIAENDDRYAAAAFEEGHYLQVEVAALVKAARQPELARRFLAFVVSPGFQKSIPTGNWMYPVIEPAEDLPPAFAALPRPKISLLIPPEEVAAYRKRWIDDWLEAMSR